MPNPTHRANTMLALGESAFMIDATADDFAEAGLDLGETSVGPILAEARIEVEGIAEDFGLRGEPADRRTVQEAEAIVRATRRALDLAAMERDQLED